MVDIWNNRKGQGHDPGEFNHPGALTADVVFQTDFLARPYIMRKATLRVAFRITRYFNIHPH